MANLPYLVRLAFADESTPGTPPANAGAWASETSIQIVADSLDPSGLKPEVVEDLRSQINAQGREFNVEGLRNGEFSYQVYASGTGTTTSAGAQVAETALARLLENGMGGMHRSNSTAAAAAGAHSTTAIEVDADTNFAEGAHIGWEHPTTGEVYIRRLVENPSTTVWNLDEALPQAAQDGDVIHGCITIYVDPDVLANSNSSGLQLSYLVQFGAASIADDETWVTSGCVNTVSALSWGRNELPAFDIGVMWANVTLPSESPPTSISWAADPVGVAPAVVGLNGRVFFQDVGTTTATSLCLSSVELAPGIARSRVETVTEAADNMHGTCHYSVAKPDINATIVLANFSTDEFDDWNNGQLKVFRTQAGTQPGFSFAMEMPSAEVASAPSRAVQNDSSARSVELRAHIGTKDTNSLFTTDTALTRSALCLVLC